MKRYFWIVLILILSIPQSVLPCTSVIISGKYTNDGRPLMWKHRDSQHFNNKLVYIDEGKYPSIALINSEDSDVEKIWIGFNSKGFAIMNTLSRNIDGEGERNGIFMKEALMECATVEEFEQFIKNSAVPRLVKANFGVIDAKGGAAFFETGDYVYTRYDADDKRVAPHGYIVRTNFSFDGEYNQGSGYIRFETAEKLFYRAAGSNNLSLSYILEEMTLSLENPLSGDYPKKDMMPEYIDNYVYFNDCINRFTSTASIIVQGVKDGENSLLTTMWSKIGFPLSAVAIPVWITDAGKLPEIVTAKGGENAKVCDLALELKNIMIPSTRGSTRHYINATKAFNSNNTGITQQLKPINREIYIKTIEKLEKWRQYEINENEITELYKMFDTEIPAFYNEITEKELYFP